VHGIRVEMYVTRLAMVELMQQPFMTLRLDSVQLRALVAFFVNMYMEEVQKALTNNVKRFSASATRIQN